ncbi:MAG: hypothetical protein WCK90_01590 [archaeon]
MTLNTNFPATELNFAARAVQPLLVKSLLSSKREAFKLGALIPDDLIANLEEFTRRNALSKIAFLDEEHANECCPRCLKAHAMKKAQDMGLDNVSLAFISALFPGEVGHLGYYTDGDRLIEI